MTARTLSLTALAAIVLLHGLWWTLLAAPSRVPAIMLVLLACVPAVPAAIATLRGSRLAPIWAGCASLLYFCHGVAELFAAPANALQAALEVGLALLCIGAAGWPGLRMRSSRATASPPSPPTDR